MDWNAAIEKNREALRRVLATLVDMAKMPITLAAGAHPEVPTAGEPRRTLPRHLHRYILRLLRPAEAAARRLVIVAARGLVVPAPRPRKPAPPSTGIVVPVRSTTKPRAAPRRLTLPLFDRPNLPRERRPRLLTIPRITAIGYSAPSRIAVRLPPMPRDPIDARRLLLRLEAVGRALDRLPDEAKRFARWRAARDAAVAQMKEDAIAAARMKENDDAQRHAAASPPLRSGGGGSIGSGLRPARGQAPGRIGQPARPRCFRRIGPLRPGRPPGWRRRPSHDVHEILNVTHGLAIWAMEKPDTS